MRTLQQGFKQRALALALAASLVPAMVQAEESCPVDIDEVKAKVTAFSEAVSSLDKSFKDEHAKATSSSYSKDYFAHFDNLNKNADEAHELITTAYDLTNYIKPLGEGEVQKSLPPKVTHTMSNAVEIAQAAMNEENTKLDLAELRCAQSTEDTALSSYLAAAGGSAESNYKSTKKTACKVVQLLANLQDKRDKLNQIREEGYPLFFRHAKRTVKFSGKKRTIQLKVDLRLYPEYPQDPVNETTLNGQPVLLGQLEGIDLSYNTYYKWSDDNWEDLNLYQYLISDTNKGEVCPMKIPITGSVKAKLCISVKDITPEALKVYVRAKYNYNNDWHGVDLGTITVPAPFGYLADVSDMKEKKMEDLKSKLADKLISLMGEYGEMVKKAQEWKEACAS